MVVVPRSAAISLAILSPAAVGLHVSDRRVNDELAGGEVGTGVVEDVAEPGGAGHADEDRDQRAEADRRQRRAGPRPVPGEVPEREPYRDRGVLAGGSDHLQE